MTFFQLLLLVTLFVTTDSRLTVTPEDAVRTPSSRVVFQCGTSDETTRVAWFHLPTGSSSYKTILVGHNRITADTRYSIDSNAGKGRYDLTVDQVQASDAGRFVCKDDYGFSGDEASAELIIVDNLEPNCTYSGSSVLPKGRLLEYETLHIHCKFCFYGNVYTNATWINTEGRVLASTLSSEVLHLTSEVPVCVDSGITVLGDIENSDCGYKFTADLFKSNRSQFAIFSFHWASGNILIASPVRNITISKDATSSGGVTLTCHAHGFPNVSYVWLDLTDWTVATNGSQLSVSRVSQSRAYQCNASNVIANETYSLKKVEIVGENCEKQNTSDYFYPFVACLVLLVAGVVILLGLRSRRRANVHRIPENKPLTTPKENDRS